MRGLNRNRTFGTCGAAALSLLVAGCSQPQTTDSVMSAAIRTLTAHGKDICVDRATRGEPLAIFRNMAAAPDPARRPLAWYAPRPLAAQQALPLSQIVDGEFKDRTALLQHPSASPAPPLPLADQRRLNAAATKLSYADSDRSAFVAQSGTAPKAHVRWWVLNRMYKDCGAIYTISHPVIIGDVAFVSAVAGHWGTTYAIERKDGQWRTTAQWTNWLY